MFKRLCYQVIKVAELFVQTFGNADVIAELPKSLYLHNLIKKENYISYERIRNIVTLNSKHKTDISEHFRRSVSVGNRRIVIPLGLEGLDQI